MLLRIVPAALALLVLSACSASGGGNETDGITAAELAAGASSTGEDGDEPSDDTDGDQQLDSAQDPGDPGTSAEALSACTNTHGYRHGVEVAICVTSVDGKLVEVHTAAAFQALAASARADGVHLRIVSGFRTMARQRQLYAAYRAGTGNLAAHPGFSNHQSGKALDLNTSDPGVYRWLTSHAGANRFRRTVASEKWHWED